MYKVYALRNVHTYGTGITSAEETKAIMPVVRTRLFFVSRVVATLGRWIEALWQMLHQIATWITANHTARMQRTTR